MKKILTLIVDDEEPALNRVENILKSDKDFLIHAACDNADEALTILKNTSIDLILLDIEMPGMTGFDLLTKLDPDKIPLVVLITAYDNYAFKAFEYYAIDYVLKPFSNERFKKMLGRVKQQLTVKRSSHIQWKDVHHSLTEGDIPGKITVKTGKKYHIVDPMEISYICAEGNYCRIVLQTKEKLLHRDTISHLLTILPSQIFIRIHQSYIIATGSIKQIIRGSFGDLSVKMNDGALLKVSRKYKSKVKQVIN